MRKALDDDLVMSLVEHALSQPSELREEDVRSACDSDAELFNQVWDYVDSEERMSGFLQHPALDYFLRSFPDPAFSEHPFQPGELLIGRFRIVRQVAEGGMGIVYEAVDERLQRRVAIKCAKTGFGNRLPPEVRHASEISHPNVCKIFDIHTASTALGEIDFLSMEFLDGETLAERLRAGPPAESEVRTIANQLCAGLAEAHRNRVIHGDLKSNNVILTSMLDGSVRAVITDFGLARGLSVSVEASAQGQIMQSAPVGGAPAYMAPELRKGGKPGTTSDVYALGVILSELVSEIPPGASTEEQSRKPLALQTKWSGVITRCLDPDPARRFEDAGRLLHTLAPPRPRRWIMGAIAAVLLAAASGLVTYQRATAPKQTVRLALLPFRSTQDTGQLAVRLSRDAAVQLAHLKSNSQTKFVFIPESDVVARKVDTIEKARTLLSATHVLQGTLEREDINDIVRVYLTDTRSGVNTTDRQLRYQPAQLRYAPVALAGIVTSTLRLPPVVTKTSVNAAARHDYLTGLSYVQGNIRPDESVAELELAVAADPDSPVAYAGLAEAQFFKYNFTNEAAWKAEAQESVRQAELRNPDVSEVHTISGLLKANSSLYELAKSDYERAIELQPNNGDAYRRLSGIYYRNAQPDEAFAAIRKAIDVQPGEFLNYQQLGTLHIRRGNYQAALPAFQKMVAVAPNLAETHMALGAALEFLGRFAEAETELRISLRLQESSDAEHELGTILVDLGRNREAIACFRRALEIGPKTAELWLNLGRAYSREGLAGDAKDSFRQGMAASERALMRDPREGSDRARLAYQAARLGDLQRGESEIAQALRVSPGDSETRIWAVLTYEVLGRRDQSLGLLASGPSILGQLDRYFELADLRRDYHVQQLLRSNGSH